MKSKFSISQFLNKIVNNVNLTTWESELLMKEMLQGNLTQVQIAAILVALRMKGETHEEILGFIKVMRKKMNKVKIGGLVIDTCGTGGDGSGTFNISTAAALVAAGVGIKVAKHGNRSASSLCGSADVLEKLGVNIQLTPEQAEECLENVGITFLFAPLYHPAMKYVVPVRKELGFRSVFNFLGPLLNPSGVKRQIIGVPNKEIAEKLAEVAKRLDYEHLLIVTSGDGLDEISVSADTHIFELKNKQVTNRRVTPESFGFKKALRNELRGGDASYNADIICRILDGEKGPKRDVVVVNSAAALYIAGKVKDITEGIKLAEESIDSGRAKKILKNLINETQKYA